MRKLTTAAAFIFSLAVPAFGYLYLGKLVAALFLVGYFGGFILWMLVPTKSPYPSFKIPFWATFLVFLLFHKTEERVTNFFQVLSNEITGVPVPEVSPGLIVCLLIVPVGAWLSIPILTKRGSDFGYFLAWTFFASMGITELAHFILPFFVARPYGYFPGMASVTSLAPLAWWGMWRLSGKNSPSPHSQGQLKAFGE